MGKVTGYSFSHNECTLVINWHDLNEDGSHNYSGTLTDTKKKKHRFEWTNSEYNGLTLLSGPEALFDYYLFSQAIVST